MSSTTSESPNASGRSSGSARTSLPTGTALVAAWCPGGRYLDADELTSLVRRSFRIVAAEQFETGHLALVCRRKRQLVALTFDYETWQPIPQGRHIDWEVDVFEPATRAPERRRRLDDPGDAVRGAR